MQEFNASSIFMASKLVCVGVITFSLTAELHRANMLLIIVRTHSLSAKDVRVIDQV